MEIISFTGKSGTGKSFNAARVCRMNNIEAIIDDGLLIYKGAIVAGRSAKRCSSKAAAMRTALFDNEEHRKEVQDKLAEISPARLMVIGTSDHMVDWITDALGLHRADRRMYITDVTTENEREIAGKSRNEDGEHAIPVPMAQIKRDFAGYFINPMRFLRSMTMEGGDSDRTVVRPTFSYRGKFEISEQVIEDIINIAAEKHKGCFHVLNFYHNANAANFNVIIDVRIRKIPGISRHCILFQKEVCNVIEKMTSFSIGNVNIQITDIAFQLKDLESWRKSPYSG